MWHSTTLNQANNEVTSSDFINLLPYLNLNLICCIHKYIQNFEINQTHIENIFTAIYFLLHHIFSHLGCRYFKSCLSLSLYFFSVKVVGGLNELEVVLRSYLIQAAIL